MQTGSEQLMAQQRIMASKNLYNGKIDGIWGPKTIAAKQKWERSGKFTPGIPNNGFPLNDRGPLPQGVTRKADGTLTCAEIIAAEAAEAAKQPKPQEQPRNDNKQQQNQGNKGQVYVKDKDKTVHVQVAAQGAPVPAAPIVAESESAPAA